LLPVYSLSEGNNMEEEKNIADQAEKERIPVFSSWRNWYLFVVGFLAFQIFLFYLFTKYFG
jgi:hypothetical protein